MNRLLFLSYRSLIGTAGVYRHDVRGEAVVLLANFLRNFLGMIFIIAVTAAHRLWRNSWPRCHLH